MKQFFIILVGLAILLSYYSSFAGEGEESAFRTELEAEKAKQERTVSSDMTEETTAAQQARERAERNQDRRVKD
jgi:hypothetical protein